MEEKQELQRKELFKDSLQRRSEVFTVLSGKVLRGIVAGGTTGGIEICISYPTEYIKTQLQLDEKGDKKKFKGLVDCAVKTVQENGFLGLYRGLSILLLGSIPKSAVRFGAYESFSHMLTDCNGKVNARCKFLSGMVAGVSEAILVVTPMETIKVKFINDQRSAKPQFTGLFQGVRQIVHNEGFSGIYKGLPATIIKQGSNQATRFCVVGILKDWYTSYDSNVKVPKPIITVFGCLAGATSVFGNNPIDVVKTRMQSLEAKQYRNTLDCFYKIVRIEGPLALYKGTIPRLCRVCLDAGITFTLYEIFTDVINKFWK